MGKKEDGLEVEGVVVEALRGRFRINVIDAESGEPNGHEVIAQLAGKLRKHYIRIVPGDKVRVEVSPYDLSRGRITYRYK